MHRTNVLRHYHWRPLCTAVRSWYEQQQLAMLELPVSDVDRTFGNLPSALRAGTLLIKLRSQTSTAFILFVTPAGTRANLTAIRKTLGASTAWLSTIGEVQSLTRSVPGCVPPFGSMFSLPVLLDAQLLDCTELFAPSGRPGYAIRIPVDAFIRAERPQVIDVDRRVVRDAHDMLRA